MVIIRKLAEFLPLYLNFLHDRILSFFLNNFENKIGIDIKNKGHSQYFRYRKFLRISQLYNITLVADSQYVNDLSWRKGNDIVHPLYRIENGNRPLVTVVLPDGSEKALRIEAVPRYNNLIFFEQNGKPVKREELKKEQGVALDKAQGKAKVKEKSKDKSSELSM